jgi:hypothetical protein
MQTVEIDLAKIDDAQLALTLRAGKRLLEDMGAHEPAITAALMPFAEALEAERWRRENGAAAGTREVHVDLDGIGDESVHVFGPYLSGSGGKLAVKHGLAKPWIAAIAAALRSEWKSRLNEMKRGSGAAVATFDLTRATIPQLAAVAVAVMGLARRLELNYPKLAGVLLAAAEAIAEEHARREAQLEARPILRQLPMGNISDRDLRLFSRWMTGTADVAALNGKPSPFFAGLQETIYSELQRRSVQ